MVTYPIRIMRNGYRGANPRKQAKAAEENRIAADLEAKINAILRDQQEPIRVYYYHEIAERTGYDIETVRHHGFSIDAGSGGFTAWRHDMTYEQAWEAHTGRSSSDNQG